MIFGLRFFMGVPETALESARAAVRSVVKKDIFFDSSEVGAFNWVTVRMGRSTNNNKSAGRSSELYKVAS